MKKRTAAFVVVAGLAAHATFAQTQGTAAPADRATTVARLLKELRWTGAEGHKAYLQTKDEQTKRVLDEVDGLVAESLSPGTTTAGHVKARLDTLLGHKKGDMEESAAFSVNLPSGRFLVVGVEVRRGGGAISENAMSLRAYRETENQYVPVADADYLHTGDPTWEDGFQPLADLRVKALTLQPIGNEFWFIAWAEVPPRSPYTVTMRLFGFDGEKFRTIWTTDDFMTPNVNRAIQITADGGFILRTTPYRGPDVNKQYAVTADGPQKVTEWETQER
jgi:hypothetical protein